MSLSVTIIELKPLSKGFFRIRVKQNEQEITLKMHQETVFKHRLSTTQTYLEKAWQTIVQEDAYFTLFDYALARLAERDHTRVALKEKLRRKNQNLACIEQVLDQLEKNQYLDETRARNRLRDDFLQGPPKGPKLLHQTLLKAGFNEADCTETLASISESVWVKRCETFCQDALRKAKEDTRVALQRKIFTAALTQGFSRTMIEPMIERLFANHTFSDPSMLLNQRFSKLKTRYDLHKDKERAALMRTLMRQGFSYSAIKKLFESEGY